MTGAKGKIAAPRHSRATARTVENYRARNSEKIARRRMGMSAFNASRFVPRVMRFFARYRPGAYTVFENFQRRLQRESRGSEIIRKRSFPSKTKSILFTQNNRYSNQLTYHFSRIFLISCVRYFESNRKSACT